LEAEAIINNLKIIISPLERTQAELILTQIIEQDERFIFDSKIDNLVDKICYKPKNTMELTSQ